MFALQKILARLFFPLPIAFWLAIAAGVVAWRSRRGGTHLDGSHPDRAHLGGRRDGGHPPRLARVLAIAAVVWLFLVSWNPVGDALLGTLERRHPPLEEVPSGVTHIVVLGGGAHAAPDRHATVLLSRSSQGRVLEGVRLWRAAAASRASGIPELVFTGGSPDGRRSMASLAAETARELGVPPGYIVTFEEALNTEAEARAVAEYLGVANSRAANPGATNIGESDGLLLVTGASHMPRALALFRRAGLDPLPAPAQFLTDPGARSSWSFFPDAGALAKTESFFYEMLGIAWMWVRG